MRFVAPIIFMIMFSRRRNCAATEIVLLIRKTDTASSTAMITALSSEMMRFSELSPVTAALE